MKEEIKHNKIRGPINAWVLNVLSDYMDWLWGESKRSLFKNHPETVVEIGSGAGSNMRYLKKGTKLIAVEPNIHMHNDLENTAGNYGIHLEIKPLMAEYLDLPDNSFDFVVSTLVLCTVENPVQCINQIRRILKPGGVFVFIEHVKANDNLVLSWIQKVLHKPWHWFFEGCNTNRDIKSLLESGGFSTLDLEQYNLYSPFIAIIPQIRGKAYK